MIEHCCYCKKNIYDDNYIWFSYGKGILCRECYKSYDKEIESIEKKYKVKRGFFIKKEATNE